MKRLCESTILVIVITLCGEVFSLETTREIKGQELTFENRDAVYSGTLSMPPDKGNCPALMLS
ncbi:MAG: hypothetical protein ISS70_14725 [Phycisphaerae bacterium]|nr:hypothetical protein [Phycisphaerae bacterium]